MDLPKLREFKTGINSFFFTKQVSLSSGFDEVSFTDLPELDVIVTLNRSFEYADLLILESIFQW